MMTDPGPFGTPDQIRLQLRSLAMAGEIAATPGLSHSGRIFSCDDPDVAGWDILAARLAEDGVVGFRALGPDAAEKVRRWAATRGGLHEWSVLLGTATEMLAAADMALDTPLPSGLCDIGPEAMADDSRLAAMQALMAGAGIAPLARASLRGAAYPSLSCGIADVAGHLVAAANAAMQFNRHSPWADTAWIGLVCVAEACRGRRLGIRVTAAAVRTAVSILGAARCMAFVSDDNPSSRAMLLRCGFQPSPYRSLAVGGRFTR